MNPRPCFLSLQHRLCPLLSLVTLLFLYFHITKTYIYHPYCILHLYHHLFAELVHLYNLPLYWVCWGHKRLFVIWLQGCLRETIFILRLPRIDKPQVIHLREICYCPTNLCTWRPNNVYKKKVAQQTSRSSESQGTLYLWHNLESQGTLYLWRCSECYQVPE